MQEKISNFLIKQVGPEEDRTLKFVGTNEEEDRDGDVLLTSGGRWDNYLKNPVFLAMHDYKKLPVGRTLQVIPDYSERKTSFIVKFPTIAELSSDPNHPSEHALFADTVYQMYKNKYLNAVSVGFVGIEREPRNRGGWLYREYEGLELSAVTIPSNRSALAEARSKGIISDKQANLFNKNYDIDIKSIKYEQMEIDLESIDFSEYEKSKHKYEDDPVFNSIIRMAKDYKPYISSREYEQTKEKIVILDLGGTTSVLRGREASEYMQYQADKKRKEEELLEKLRW